MVEAFALLSINIPNVHLIMNKVNYGSIKPPNDTDLVKVYRIGNVLGVDFFLDKLVSTYSILTKDQKVVQISAVMSNGAEPIDRFDLSRTKTSVVELVVPSHSYDIFMVVVPNVLMVSLVI